MPGRAPCDVVRCPVGVVWDQPDTVRCPADFTRFFHVQWWIHLYQNSPLFLQINRLLIKKDWGWLWQWWWWKPHLLKTAKKISSSAAQNKYIFCIYVLVFRSGISMLMQYVILQKHVTSHRWLFDSYHIGRHIESVWRLLDIVRAPFKSYDLNFKQ